MQTRDEVEGLHNRREFSQRLESLYQAMQTQAKVFYCYYKITFMRKNAKHFVMALTKREILSSQQSQSLVDKVLVQLFWVEIGEKWIEMKEAWM